MLGSAATQVTICGLAALCAWGLAWYTGRAAGEITYVTLADGRRTERRLPLVFRMLLPFLPGVKTFFATPRFERVRENVQRRLVAAGFDALLKPEEFLGLRVLVPCMVGPVMILLMWLIVGRTPGRIGAALAPRQFLFHFVVLLYAYAYPGLWLKAVVARRHRGIQRALPFVLDLLTLSVEAGMDFMSAIRRIVDRREVDALGEELVRVLREIQVGRTRRVALRDMARRIDQSDVHSVVHALVQADELGVSIGSILRVQSEQMRNKRFARAEKLANEAPVKMLFPLVAFIFPCVFIVLLGPIIMQMVRYGM